MSKSKNIERIDLVHCAAEMIGSFVAEKINYDTLNDFSCLQHAVTSPGQLPHMSYIRTINSIVFNNEGKLHSSIYRDFRGTPDYETIQATLDALPSTAKINKSNEKPDEPSKRSLTIDRFVITIADYLHRLKSYSEVRELRRLTGENHFMHLPFAFIGMHNAEYYIKCVTDVLERLRVHSGIEDIYYLYAAETFDRLHLVEAAGATGFTRNIANSSTDLTGLNDAQCRYLRKRWRAYFQIRPQLAQYGFGSMATIAECAKQHRQHRDKMSPMDLCHAIKLKYGRD